MKTHLENFIGKFIMVFAVMITVFNSSSAYSNPDLSTQGDTDVEREHGDPACSC